MQFERGDFMAEGDSMTYIPLLPFACAASITATLTRCSAACSLTGIPTQMRLPVLLP